MKRLCVLLLLSLIASGCIHITGSINGRPVDLHVDLQPRGTAPTQTVQPSPAPSITSTATVTRTPSATSTPVVSVPSPTHEITAIPTVAETTIPKPTPTAQPGACIGVVLEDGTRLRSTPSTANLSNLVDVLAKGDVLTIEGRTIDGNWLKIWDGYVWASLVNVTGTGCASLPTVSTSTAFGIWVGPGASNDELLSFGRTLKAAGMQPAATVLGANDTARLLYNDGWIVALRPFIGDHPVFTFPAEINARIWWGQVREATAGVPYTWLVVANEPVFPSAEYARDWIGEIVARAQADRVHVVPVVFATGHPEFEWLSVLRPVLDQLKVAGGCFGLNQYPARVGMGAGEFNTWSAYTTYRYRLMRDQLPAGLPICVTEFARADGSEPPDFTDIAAYVGRVDGDLLWATAWYDAIPLGHWPNATMRGQLDKLAMALQ